MAASLSAYNVYESADRIGLSAFAPLKSGLSPLRPIASDIAILRTQACGLVRAMGGAAQPCATRFRS